MTQDYAEVKSIAIGAHTIEFGPAFPPTVAARAAWRAFARDLYFDRFGGRGVWLAADWQRTGTWPIGDGLINEALLEIDGLPLRTARYSLVDMPFIENLLRSPGFQWDGILLIDHVGPYDALVTCVRQWFDSIENEQSLLHTKRDAVYPVADGFGLRYTNASRTVEALTADVHRLVAAGAQ